MKKSRISSHKIGQSAENIVKSTVDCGDAIYRKLGSTDYGLDAMVELFDNDRITGKFVLLQVKGSRKRHVPMKRRPEVVSCEAQGNALKYAKQRNIPVVLVAVHVPENLFYYTLVNSDDFESKLSVWYLPSANMCKRDEPDFVIWLKEIAKAFYPE